jgi:hypothetical protein
VIHLALYTILIKSFIWMRKKIFPKRPSWSTNHCMGNNTIWHFRKQAREQFSNVNIQNMEHEYW